MLSSHSFRTSKSETTCSSPQEVSLSSSDMTPRARSPRRLSSLLYPRSTDPSDRRAARLQLSLARLAPPPDVNEACAPPDDGMRPTDAAVLRDRIIARTHTRARVPVRSVLTARPCARHREIHREPSSLRAAASFPATSAAADTAPIQSGRIVRRPPAWMKGTTVSIDTPSVAPTD